jgi:hypothetical protein
MHAGREEKLLVPPEEGLEAIRVLEEIDEELKGDHSRTASI